MMLFIKVDETPINIEDGAFLFVGRTTTSQMYNHTLRVKECSKASFSCPIQEVYFFHIHEYFFIKEEVIEELFSRSHQSRPRYPTNFPRSSWRPACESYTISS